MCVVFLTFSLFFVPPHITDENSTDKNTLYTVVYRIKNRQSLDEYFKNHAPKVERREKCLRVAQMKVAMQRSS